jgi:hypothetical protein
LHCHRTGGDSGTGECRGEANSLCPAGSGEKNAGWRNAAYVIAFEMTFESDVFMLGLVTKTKYTIDTRYESEYMGTRKPGDHVVEVRKLEPVQSGSSRFTF